MISSSARYGQRSSRSLVSRYPKTAFALGGVLLIAVVAGIMNHTGTYSVALASMPASTSSQPVVQASNDQSQAQHKQQAPAQMNASSKLVRIDQTSPEQYSNTQEYNDWNLSTCSATSLTEVMNAYGHNYKVTDILAVMIQNKVISSDLGLLYPEGVDKTAAAFGFDTQTLQNPSLSQILKIADSGKPVIVNFPPDTWRGGHYLVVLGSKTVDGKAYVHLADSSTLNMQYMLNDRFIYYWRGLAKVVTPRATNTLTTNPSSIVGTPTVTAEFINKVLTSAGSPAQGKGQAIYDLGVEYGIDPVFALAFFEHESNFGKNGEARSTLSPGNLRCIKNYACVDQDRGGYAKFDSWEEGFRAWYALIKDLYITAWGRTTIEEIIPKYAPSSDNNDEQAYINSVMQQVQQWRSGNI